MQYYVVSIIIAISTLYHVEGPNAFIVAAAGWLVSDPCCAVLSQLASV